MSKALVIKGVNFSANKVATIEFDRVHTTDLSIDDSSISLTSLGGTHQIQYTLTPANAEDPVEWSSSNTAVCTVDDQGVVTATGCGTATITGTSNGHSDTVSVTCVIEMTGFVRAPRTYIYSVNASGHASGADTYIGLTNTGYDVYMAMVATDSTKEALNANYLFAALDSETNKYYLPDDYPATSGNSYRVFTNIGYVVPIKLPAGCTSVKLVGLNGKYAPYVMWYKTGARANDSDESQLYFSSYKKASPMPNNYSWDYKQETTVAVESGYDSIVIMWRANTSDGATDFANLTESQIAEFKLICA